MFFIFLIGGMLSVVVAHAGVPAVSHVMITDVTTRSFSVAWASSEASYPDIHVYNDANGVTPTAGAVVTLQPVRSGNSAIGNRAEDNGVLKVIVSGFVGDGVGVPAAYFIGWIYSRNWE